MSSPTRREPQTLDAPADLTMAVTQSDESHVPAPIWETTEQVFAALESPLLPKNYSGFWVAGVREKPSFSAVFFR